MENRFLTEAPQTQYQAPPVTPQELTTQEEQEASEQQQEQVVTEFAAKMKKRALRYRNSGLFALTLMLLIFGLSIAYLATHPGSSTGSVILLLSLCGGVLYTLGSTLLAGLRGPGRDIKELVRLNGIRAIGPLIEMRGGFLNKGQVVTTYDMLIELLPQLTARDVNLLNSRHRTFLYEVLEGVGQNFLSSKQQNDLRLAILEALKQVGDARAVPVVKRVAKVPFWQKKPNAIQKAAQECLPILEANLANVLSTQTLLRASAPEAASGDTLLRPATPTAEHSPEQLLRAASTTTSQSSS